MKPGRSVKWCQDCGHTNFDHAAEIVGEQTTAVCQVCDCRSRSPFLREWERGQQ